MTVLDSVLVDQVCSLLKRSRADCVTLSEILSKLGLRTDVDKVAKMLFLSRKVRVYFDIAQDEYIVCRRAEENGNGVGGKVTMQEIVDELRKKFDNEPVPKPMIVDYLKEKVPDKYEAVYNMLLNDGVIEEIDISGMVFVRIVK